MSNFPTRIIKPSHGWVQFQWRELWKYRELLYFLCWRDIKVRYKQTALGAAWAIIQPLFTMLVFSIFFGKLGKIPSDDIPYPLFSYTALLPWTLFANGLSQASNSLVGNSNLITKVYFPRMVIPLSSVLSGLLDFVIALSVFVGLMIFYQVWPAITMIWLIPFLILNLITTLGVSLWLSALNVQYRDVRYAVPFLTQFWLFITPIAYPSSLLTEPWRSLYGLNPMAGVVEGFRWALLGTKLPVQLLIVSTVIAIIFLLTGAYYFRSMEKRFADIV